jgi:hypothetical protein
LHFLTIALSHLLAFASLHLLTFASLHLLAFASLHLLTFTSSHLLNCLYGIQMEILGFWTFPSSGILKTRKRFRKLDLFPSSGERGRRHLFRDRKSVV